MTTNVSNPTAGKAHGSLWTGILLIVFGVAGIVLPNIATLVSETWIAILLTMSGIGKVVYSFQTRQQGGFIWKLLLGVLYIATGLMLFVYPLTGVLTLTLLLGSFFLTEGVFNLILAFRLRPQANWLWILVDGIVTLGLGALIWFQWPSNAPWLLGTLVGISVLSTGVSRVMLSLNMSNPADPGIDEATPVA